MPAKKTTTKKSAKPATKATSTKSKSVAKTKNASKSTAKASTKSTRSSAAKSTKKVVKKTAPKKTVAKKAAPKKVAAKKVAPKKVVAKKAEPVKSAVAPREDKVDYAFVGLLILFVALSIYAIVSYFGSTGRGIEKRFNSVLDAQEAQEIEEEQREQIFTDVRIGHPNEEAITALYEYGVISGYSDGSFQPEKTMTRAEFWALLTNAVDANLAGQVLENCFGDVTNQWFAPYVCYAKREGYVTGFEDGNYRPDQPVNKAEALKMILVAFDYEIPAKETILTPPYNDAGIDDWYTPYALAAKKKEFLQRSMVFSPGYLVTRGDVSGMIYKVMQDQGVF